ncbi:DUF4410 domain-containing protein [Paraburkholderia sp. BCC1886]|uniref:DUF4410 domain-containing protein n=1 Tax=Paraburkholderia sp. BCC1886 TaxID=2562670 RepID=UPI001183802A|nr:DUF4410 domain-containing protein [Paraburkholderia sp. BCC1886]
MPTSTNFLKHHAARLTCAAVVCCSALLTGCAGSKIHDTNEFSSEPHARPDTIYVYAFDCDPAQVKLDGGVVEKLASHMSSTSIAQKQSAEATAMREQVADEIVHRLQKMGLNALRSDTPAPLAQNALLVEGHFDSIDSGNRGRRIMIGLGAGQSEVISSVQILYKPAGSDPRLVQSFSASADSGNAPGIVETAGVGALAGSIATSAAVGAGVHTFDETKRANVSADAARLADAVARQVGQIGVDRGWLTTKNLKG